MFPELSRAPPHSNQRTEFRADDPQLTDACRLQSVSKTQVVPSAAPKEERLIIADPAAALDKLLKPKRIRNIYTGDDGFHAHFSP